MSDVHGATPYPDPLIIGTPAEMREWRNRIEGVVGFVPTMGALHDGHLALVADAAARAEHVVVSIFVNPLQFDRSSDLDAYPRTFDADVAMCASAGVAAIYAPSAATMYPEGFQTRVEPGDLTDRLEGASREGHFTGVATVVTKLLAAVRPDLAVFGEKDAQQLAVVRRLVTDLDLGVEIVGHPTVRDHDGLAMSSRNRRLGAAERAAARCVPEALWAMRDALRSGERAVAELIDVAVRRIEAEPLARLDYLQVIDEHDFTALHGDLEPDATARAVVAVWLGEVRLIDNLALSS